jgi:hypothetical protein
MQVQITTDQWDEIYNRSCQMTIELLKFVFYFDAHNQLLIKS